MSIKDRLNKKTAGLFIPPKADATGTVDSKAAGQASPLRTGPGQMLMVNTLMKENNGRLAALEDKVREFDGAVPTRLLDPSSIVNSKWANREAVSFDTAEFHALKAEISQAGGNVQPIKVRPAAAADSQYEIVFGHRRHRACLELGMPVLALVEEVSDKDLFIEMDRENRARLDLSPWEQGMMYRRALADRLFSSREHLARELGVDPGNLSKALRLAELDETVVAAFASPLDLQYRFAKPLYDALQADRETVLARARTLASQRHIHRSAKEVLQHLLGLAPVDAAVRPAIRVDMLNDGEKVTMTFVKGKLGISQLAKLQELVQKFLASQSE